MDTLSKTRALVYALGLAGSILAAMGYADFDAATGLLDLKPVNIYALVGAASGIGASGLALLAVIKGWGGKKAKP